MRDFYYKYISSLIDIIEKTSFQPKFWISISAQSGDTSPQIFYRQVGKSVFRNCEFGIENFSFRNFEFGILDCNRNNSDNIRTQHWINTTLIFFISKRTLKWSFWKGAYLLMKLRKFSFFTLTRSHKLNDSRRILKIEKNLRKYYFQISYLYHFLPQKSFFRTRVEKKINGFCDLVLHTVYYGGVPRKDFLTPFSYTWTQVH